MNKLIGKKIVGYRYGEAPKCGKSYNHRERNYECGVSMACVGYYKEVGSFAVSDLLSAKKYYYEGIICGEGGDDEICLSDVRLISYKEYLHLRKEYVDTSNQYINYIFDRKIRLIEMGYNVGMSVEDIENKRKEYLR